MKRSTYEIIAFALYLLVVLAIGIIFFMRGRKEKGGDKSFFLGNRNMNGFVAALSAGASDMSAWVLMGLPGSIYLYGMGKVWISVGLLIGTICAWILVAPRLRRFSIIADDSHPAGMRWNRHISAKDFSRITIITIRRTTRSMR